MRKIFRGVAAFATAAAAVVALGGAAQARPAGDTPWYGCPSGAVCIYAQDAAPWDNPHPTNAYYSYGAHNLSNQVGNHWVLNNQYGGATASLCNGYGGADCTETVPQDYGVYRDLTPVNSITLNRP